MLLQTDPDHWKSLEILIDRWKSQSLEVLPPYGASIVRATFLEAGIEAPTDLIHLYGAIGGMNSDDETFWRLWPLDEVAQRISQANVFGVLFSDYLIDSWAYRVKPNDKETTAVYLDYHDGNDAILVARTLAEFFDRYRANAGLLLTQTK